MKRPLGVTILAILALIGGILGILAGLAGLAGGALLSSSAVTSQLGSTATQVHVNTTAVLAWSAVALILGIVDIVLAIGAFRLSPWAWTLGIGLEIISIVVAIVEVALNYSSPTGIALGVIINVIVLVYLFTPKVRAAFGH